MAVPPEYCNLNQIECRNIDIEIADFAVPHFVTPLASKFAMIIAFTDVILMVISVRGCISASKNTTIVSE